MLYDKRGGLCHQRFFFYLIMATVKEAAAQFRVTGAYIRKLCKTGKICYTIVSSRKWLVNMDSLAKFFEQGEPIVQEPQVVNGIRRVAPIKKGAFPWHRSHRTKRRTAHSPTPSGCTAAGLGRTRSSRAAKR